MTSPFVSLLPAQSGFLMPAPSATADLSDDEQRLITGLSAKLVMQSVEILQRWRYYDGLQRMQNLGISIPEELAGVRTVVDWPRICVDPLVQRLRLDGFRIPGATDVDAELRGYWQSNDLDAEAPLGFLDAMVAGRGYGIVGSPDVPGDAPIATVESPLNMTVTWDPRTRRIVNGYQAYEVEGRSCAVLYVQGQTIHMSRDERSPWTVDDRDQHGFDDIPIVRLVNRSRTSDREGRSEITAAVMNTTDSACRSLLGMEIAREVYSIPRLWILGAKESAFVNADGSAKSGLSLAMTKIGALERDAEGEVPELKQLTAFDPSVFTKIIDEHAQLMASYTGFPPAYFGQATSANPASADAIRVSENGIDRRTEQVQTQFSSPLRRLAQLMWRFAHNGAEMPAEMRQLEVDWVDASTPTPASDADAIAKQVSVGIVPATSDVTLKRLRYTDVERQRLAQDRDAADQFERELGTSVQAKAARAANAAISIVETAAVPDGTVAPPTSGTPIASR